MRSIFVPAKSFNLNVIIPYFVLLIILVCALISWVSSLAGNVYLELLSHFKVQYLILIILFFCLLLLVRKKKFIIISLFCLSITLIDIIPWYIPQFPKSLDNPAQLRILNANLNIQNQNYSEVLALVRKEKPDIAIFIEINNAWVEQLNSLKDILPNAVVRANPYNLGIAVYSQRPLEKGSITYFGGSKNPSIVARLNINQQNLTLVATHPPPPQPGGLFQTRNQHLAEISQYIKPLSTPVIIAGDLNITMWSLYYKRFIQETKLKNARQGFGLLPSWPVKTNYPPYSKIPAILLRFLSIPIDHCLISPNIQVAKIRTGPNVGSDHRPLITDLVIPI
jgi:endonuclease/exonuclease/phosphatase (EEP) superfamily protein YafD